MRETIMGVQLMCGVRACDSAQYFIFRPSIAQSTWLSRCLTLVASLVPTAALMPHPPVAGLICPDRTPHADHSSNPVTRGMSIQCLPAVMQVET